MTPPFPVIRKGGVLPGDQGVRGGQGVSLGATGVMVPGRAGGRRHGDPRLWVCAGEDVSGPGAATARPHQPPTLHGRTGLRSAFPRRRLFLPLVTRRRRERGRKTLEWLSGKLPSRISGRRCRRGHVGSESRAAIMG